MNIISVPEVDSLVAGGLAEHSQLWQDTLVERMGSHHTQSLSGMLRHLVNLHSFISRDALFLSPLLSRRLFL